MAEVTKISIGRVRDGQLQQLDDNLATEEPLEIVLVFYENGLRQSRPLSITMRTPGHDADLAAGFLFTE